MLVTFAFALVLYDRWNIVYKYSRYLSPYPANNKLDAISYEPSYSVDGVYPDALAPPDRVVRI